MPLTAGTRLGHYDVTALLGEGGMGQVWQATDTQLNREVALKILPDAFAADPDRLARFTREAQILASLNHPNIAAIYGIEEAERTRALVLELVEGPTLADRIAKGAIPIDEALPIAKQIAEALEAAHEAGVIHRDLKPANIKVREDGTVKVLDFGLAKALDPSPDADPSQSPTLPAAATQMGVIMGTAAYMSPEQARGKVVDRRADIWAFGVVLYELLTGRRAFEGEDVSLTLSAVLQQEPEWERLPDGLSPALDTYLKRCLAKDPRQRVRDIGDVRLAMTGAFSPDVSPETITAPAPQPRAWQQPVPLAAAALVLVALTVLSMATLGPSRSDLVARLPTRAVIPFPPGFQAVLNPGVAWSPDGRTLIYAVESADGQRLYRQRLDQSVGTPFGEIEANTVRQPFFSPDGGSIGFFTGTQLQTVPTDGGPPETLFTPGSPRGAVWTADGSIILAPSLRSGLARFSPGSSNLEPLTVPDSGAGECCHRWPSLLPGGETVLFTIMMDEGGLEAARVAALSLESGEVTEIVRGSSPRYVPTGHLVFARRGTLWAAPFDLGQLELTGAPGRVVEDLLTTMEGGASFDVAASGSLVYVPGEDMEGRTTLEWVSRNGTIVGTLDETPRDYRRVRLSPDGRHVATSIIAAAGGPEVWLYDVDRPTPERLAPSGSFPVWTVDSRRVLFSGGADAPGVWSLPRDRSSSDPELVVEYGVVDRWGPVMGLSDVSPGQQLILQVRRQDATRQINLMVHDLAQGGPLELFAATVFSGADLSPDGQWLAYVSDRDGQRNVYIQAFPGSGGPTRVSLNGGQDPRWAHDGQELFFRAGDRMMAVGIATEPEITVGTPQALFDLPSPEGAYDIAADGRFVMGVSRRPETASHVNVVFDWFEELTERVPIP